MRAGELERALILTAAGTATRRRAQRAQAQGWLTRISWPALLTRLRARGLLVALGPRLVELAGAGADPRFAAAAKGAVASARTQARILQLAELRIVAVLEREGIGAATLKGPALAQRAWGDPGRRMCGDIDLLVAAEHLRPAAGIVRALGYAPPADHLDRDGLPRLHLAMHPARPGAPPVELHWRIHWYERHFARERLFAPEPCDELAALLLFYARDGFSDLRLATDIGAWWDAHGTHLPAAGLAPLTRAYPELARALRAGAHAAQRTVGLPAQRVLGEQPRLGARGRLAVALMRTHPRTSPAQLYAEMGLIDGLLTPRGGIAAFIRRQLLPPRAVLDQRAGRPGSSAASYPLRAAVRLGVLARYAWALARAGLPTRVIEPRASP